MGNGDALFSVERTNGDTLFLVFKDINSLHIVFAFRRCALEHTMCFKK